MQTIIVNCRAQMWRGFGWLSPLFVGALRYYRQVGDKQVFMTRYQFADACRSKRVLTAVHGYHSPEADAIDAAGVLRRNLEARNAPYDVLVVFLWPGGITAVGFGITVFRTDDAGRKLAELIRGIKAVGATVHVVTHSLGARVALECIPLLDNFRDIALLVLMGPAVAADCLSENGQYRSAVRWCGRVLVAKSARDRVLEAAFPLAGGARYALGFSGPIGSVPANVTVVDATADVPAHPKYKDSPITLDAWMQAA